MGMVVVPGPAHQPVTPHVARDNGVDRMKSTPEKPKRASRVKTKAGRQLRRNPSEREVKDFIVAAIETSLAENLKQMGFSKREVKDLLAGSGKALTTAVREKLSDREVKK